MFRVTCCGALGSWCFVLSIGVVPAGGRGRCGRMLCQTSNEGGEGFPSILTRPSSSNSLMSSLWVRPSQSATQIDQMNGPKDVSRRYVAIGADWYAAECVNEVCREVEPQTDTLPPLAAVIVLPPLPVTVEHNRLLTFIAWFWDCNNP